MAAKEPPDGVLFQEWIDDPFWMLVACQLVNLTTWRQARPCFEWLRETSVDPINLAMADPEDLHEHLEPLGLWRRRASMLPRFARSWLTRRPVTAKDVLMMPGCGKYAADSWSIFVEGDLGVEPNDGKLNWYLDRRQTDEYIRCDLTVRRAGARHGEVAPAEATAS